MLIAKQELMNKPLVDYKFGGSACPLTSFNAIRPAIEHGPYDYDDYDDYGDNDGYVMSGVYETHLITLEAGETLGEAIRRAADGGLYVVGKSIRPWTVIEGFFEGLNQDAVWRGFEVEHGYRTSEDAVSGLQWIDKNTDDACIDVEGIGSWPIEVTFAPTDSDDWYTTCGPVRLINAVEAGEYPKPVDHDSEDQIGTHFNFSTPAVREAGNDKVTSKALTRTCYEVMASAIGDLGWSDRYNLFGRSNVYVYEPVVRGGKAGYYNSDDPRSKSPTYLECKWFNTTFDKAQFYSNLRLVEWVVDFFSDIERIKRAADEDEIVPLIVKDLQRLAKIQCRSAEDFERLREDFKCRV